MRLTVIGTGYLGAVHAACLAEIGHEVLGVDVDAARIAALSEGRAPFFEPGFPEVLTRNLASGRLRFSTSSAEAAAFGDVHFLCVGTPQQPGSQAADLTYLDAAVADLAAGLRPGALVVGKSTVPVGTAARLAARVPAEVAWNPEFLREGFAVEDTLRPDRLVVGVTSSSAEAVLREVYAPMLAAGVPWVSTDLATAELVKVAANSFLATKISFINAMAEVCEATGGDVATLAEAIGYDVRIGRQFLRAGIGFGGGCLPKDIRAFRHRAAELGVSLGFLGEVDEINLRRRARAVTLARELVGGSFAGRNVAVLGATFKPDSDDVRDSPALAVASAIRAEGARVTVHDPQGVDNARAAFPGLDYSPGAQKACEGAHVVLHLTEWDEYRELDPEALGEVVAARALVDGRNALDASVWRAAGWTVRALGRR
ncbi:UDP-glucose dehydrogenase family protein [Cryptosporangium phraense]|uniref:UDP-glucose 6-dehydrogenase n=1 Tax=Cryptosporangium phraense TaxID=2593070 RepID=A0A545AGR9_9ACTN|nr:UDP-glucose/GDP-mannose dehydrogenase family protein [Cryptosporangium phraense]TQS40528.1 UDP-glucose/GDP-mannose dehydrogenase family protein [Cryptosporangium phraense]